MKKTIIFLLVLSLLAGCSHSSAPLPTPPQDDFDVSKLSFDEFDELYGQMMYEGLPEDRTNLALGNANGVWRYNLKIRNDSSGGGMYDELGFAEITVSNSSDPPVKLVLHPRISTEGDPLTDESIGYEPFTGGFDENKSLKLTGNDCVLVIKRYYLWNGKEYLIATMWLSEEDSGDFMMIRESSSSTDNNDPASLEEDGLPEYSGSSKAFTSTPCEEVTVSADSGAFKTDTNVKFTSLNAIPDKYTQIKDDLMAEWNLPVCAWEVDAGLNDDEVIPGAFEVEIDLEKLGIDPDFWPAFSVARIGDDGSYYEYSIVQNENKVTFLARQNSIIIGTIIVGAAIYKGAKTIDYVTQTHYFRSRHDILGRFMESKDVQTEYGKYEIWWTAKDYQPDDAAKLDRIHEIELAYENETKEYAKTIQHVNELDRNRELAAHYKALLESNEEYGELKANLKIPDAITQTIQYINTAYDYLGRVERVRMPFGKVVFQARGDGDDKENKGKLGLAEKKILQTVVSLWPHKALVSQQDRDNYLLTITHELFHVCQERYRLSAPLVNKLTDDPRYDEMITMVLERDAKKYYQKENIITTDPRLTDKNVWDTLRLPVDKEPDSKGTDDGDSLKMREGYMLGDFVMYLQTQFPKPVSNAHTLMKARSFAFKPTVSAALMKVFGLTEAEFDTFFRKWLISKRDEIMPLAVGNFYSASYFYERMTKVKGGNFYHVNLEEDDSYFLKLRGFMKDESVLNMTGILVPDADFRKNHSSIQLMTLANDYISIPNGIYLSNITTLMIAEIYGKLEKGENMKVGYTLWTFGKTGSVELEANEKVLSIKLPQKSKMAENGLIDGYLLTIAADGNKIVEEEIEKERFETTLEYSKAELLKNTDKKELTVSVTICEYVRDNNGNRCMGWESDPVQIMLSKAGDDGGQGGNTEQITSGNLYLYKDQTCVFDGDIIDSMLNDPHYTILSWPGSNKVLIDGNKVTIVLEALNWSFTGKDVDNRIAEAQVTYTRDSIQIFGELVQAYADNSCWYRITGINKPSFSGKMVETGVIRDKINHNMETSYEYSNYNKEESVKFSNIEDGGKITVQFKDGEVSFVEIALYGTYEFYSYSKREGDEYEPQESRNERTFSQMIKLMK